MLCGAEPWGAGRAGGAGGGSLAVHRLRLAVPAGGRLAGPAAGPARGLKRRPRTGQAMHLPRLIKGRKTGPLFLTRRRARVELPPGDIDPETRYLRSRC